MATRFFKPKIDKYIQLYSKYAYVEEGTRGTGRVKSIEITDDGFFYEDESNALKPTVIISAPDEAGGVQATAVVADVDDNYPWGVLKINVTNEGSGYLNPPTVTIVSPSFDGDDDDTNDGITYIYAGEGQQGSGYVSETTTIFISPPDVEGGVQATATPNIVDGRVDSITITNYGSGYTTAPTAEVIGEYGSGAVLTVLTKRGYSAKAIATIGFDAYVVSKKYVWELDSPVVVDENALIQVVDRQFTGIETADIETPIVIRMHELSSKSVVHTQNRSRFNDSFYTGSIVDIGKPDRKLPNDIKLEIKPQNIHKISLSINQGLSTSAGISTNIEFVIILKITEKEPTMLEYGSLNNINVNQI